MYDSCMEASGNSEYSSKSQKSPVRHGPWFEDFHKGKVLLHGGRSITETDNTWFTLLTCNTNPIHYDKTYAEGTEFGQLLINSTLTLALVTGLSVAHLSMNGVNLGWHDVLLPAPLFVGDTVTAKSEVLECRPSASRPHMGIVRVKTTGQNQHGDTVIEFERSVLIPKRVPDIAVTKDVG